MQMSKKVVSFDFDDTLCMADGSPNAKMMDLVRKYAQEGFKCYIVTARNKQHESSKWIRENQPDRVRVKDFIKEHDLPIKQVHFTNHIEKGPILFQIESIRHYDDSHEHLKSAREHGIEAIHPEH
jgi:hypothetical protein